MYLSRCRKVVWKMLSFLSYNLTDYFLLSTHKLPLFSPPFFLLSLKLFNVSVLSGSEQFRLPRTKQKSKSISAPPVSSACFSQDWPWRLCFECGMGLVSFDSALFFFSISYWNLVWVKHRLLSPSDCPRFERAQLDQTSASACTNQCFVLANKPHVTRMVYRRSLCIWLKVNVFIFSSLHKGHFHPQPSSHLPSRFW